MRTYSLVLVALIVSFTTLYSQNTPTIAWQKLLGGSSLDVPAGHLSTSDNGLLIVGTTTSTDGDLEGLKGAQRRSQGVPDIWVVKLGANHEIEWQTIVEGSEWDSATGVAHAVDDGYIITAVTSSTNGDYSTSMGSGTTAFIKIDEAGSVMWVSKTDARYITCVRLTSNGDFIFTGFSSSWNCMVGVLTPWGFIRWTKEYESKQADDIYETADKGFILCGSTSPGSTQWLAKLNTTGDIEWQKTFTFSVVNSMTSMTPLAKGGFAITAAGYIADNGPFINFKTVNASGDVIVEQIREESPCYGRGIHEFPDGNFVITGMLGWSKHWLELENIKDIMLYSTDASGNVRWSKILGGTDRDLCTRHITRDVNDDFTISAFTYSNDGDVIGNHGNADIWIVTFTQRGSDVASDVPSDEYSIVPNPVNTSLSLHLMHAATIVITDITGRTVHTLRGDPGKTEINVSMLPNGSYFISLMDGSKITGRKKFIKE